MAISVPGKGVLEQGVRFAQTDTTIGFELGTTVMDTFGGFWVYCDGNGTQAQYEYVKISGDGLFTTSSLTTTTNPSTEPAWVGCLQVSGGLTTSLYGWVFRGPGYHTGLYAASCAQDVKIYTTATSGVVDDSSTTLVNGLKLITTITTAAASPAFAMLPMATVAA